MRPSVLRTLLAYGADPLTVYCDGRFHLKQNPLRATLFTHIVIGKDFPAQVRLDSIKLLCSFISQKYGILALKGCIATPFQFMGRKKKHSLEEAMLRPQIMANPSYSGCTNFVLKVSAILCDDRFRLHQMVLFNNVDMLKDEIGKFSSPEAVLLALQGPEDVVQDFDKPKKFPIFNAQKFTAAQFAAVMGYKEVERYLKVVELVHTTKVKKKGETKETKAVAPAADRPALAHNPANELVPAPALPGPFSALASTSLQVILMPGAIISESYAKDIADKLNMKPSWEREVKYTGLGAYSMVG